MNLNATLDVVVDHATSRVAGRYQEHAQLPEASRLSTVDRVPRTRTRDIAESAGRRTNVDQARFYTHARGSAMEAAAALDTMRVMKLVGETTYARGIDLLEGIVAMLTKMT